MGDWIKVAAIGIATTALCGASASAQQGQQVTGPVATYWMGAATSTGFGAGMMGGGGQRPSAGSVMGAMMGGGMNPNQVNKDLTLHLGSTHRPSGAPEAEHVPPPSLGAGRSLPLLTPAVRQTRAEPEQEALPMQRPKGRMLIYWGCGEHAPPGQPFVIDFSKIGPNMPIPQMPAMISVRGEHGPGPDRSTTYGEWPNEKTRTRVPAQGSLVGAHMVRGDYSPEIQFALGQGQDFMPPLQLSSSGRTPGGATLLSWSPVAGANGYFAMMFGGGADGQSAVMWSSSQSQTMGGDLLDYLAPSEVRRLVASKVVMSPQTNQCAVPVEVTRQAQAGFVQMIAYGDEANFSDPPRPANPKTPWNINWTVKARFKSTASAILGMEGMAGARGGYPQGGDDEEDRAPPNRGPVNRGQPQRGAPNAAGSILRGLGGGFLP